MLNIFRKKENKKDVIEEKTPAVKEENYIDTVLCDCCHINSVKVKETTMTVGDEPINILKQPIVDYKNGIIEEGVCICKECLDSCKTPKDGQLKWIEGKINSFKKIIEDKENEKKDNNDKIEDLKRLNNSIDMNIHAIKNSINKLNIDSKKIENSIPDDDNLNEENLELEYFPGKKEENIIESMNVEINE